MNRRKSISCILSSLAITGWVSPARADSVSENAELVRRITDFTEDIRKSTTAEIIDDSYRTASILSDVIAEVGACISPGMTSKQINVLLAQKLQERDLLPSMLGFKGFPEASAVSVSPAFLHSPPSSDVIVTDGSLVTIQFSAISEKSHASQGWTFPVGNVSTASRAVVDGSVVALKQAISIVRAGMSTADISDEIQKVLDEKSLSPIRDFVGYSMGQERFQAPQIFGYALNYRGDILTEGMILHIHVFATTGTGAIRVARDNFTASLTDNEPGALATAMVLVRANDGVELTREIDTTHGNCYKLS